MQRTQCTEAVFIVTLDMRKKKTHTWKQVIIGIMYTFAAWSILLPTTTSPMPTCPGVSKFHVIVSVPVMGINSRSQPTHGHDVTGPGNFAAVHLIWVLNEQLPEWPLGTSNWYATITLKWIHIARRCRAAKKKKNIENYSANSQTADTHKQI